MGCYEGGAHQLVENETPPNSTSPLPCGSYHNTPLPSRRTLSSPTRWPPLIFWVTLPQYKPHSAHVILRLPLFFVTLSLLMASPSLSPKPDPDQPPQPDPHPSQSLAIVTVAEPLTSSLPINPQPPTVTVTVTESNPNSDPPMGVPLLMPTPHLPLQTPPSSSRRLPPPCWTPEETSALIDAYRLKWYELRRGNLRAAHWEEVASDVHNHCPEVLPPKTAVQCRHKMEKLRKRYRAELLRAKSIPHHRFSSSWVYFLKMDSMEKGSSPTAPSSSVVGMSHLPNAMVALPSPPVGLNYANNSNISGGGDEVFVEDEEEGEDEMFGMRGYQQQPRSDYQRNGLRIKIAKRGYPDFDDSPNPNPIPIPNPNYGFKGDYAQRSGGSAGSSAFMMTPSPQFDEGMRYQMMKNGSHSTSNDNNVRMMMMMKKKKRKMTSVNNGLGQMDDKSRGEDRERGGGRENGEDAALEMVEAIRMLGEGFVRVEKMKMEMMRETERKRMEMEMARTQMLLESQHRIVEAFAKGWSDVLKDKDDAPSRL